MHPARMLFLGAIASVLSLSMSIRAQSGVAVTYTVTQNWGSGFQASVALANSGASLPTWTLEFTYPHIIGSAWDCTMTALGNNRYRFVGTWNSSLPAGATVTLGFSAATGTGPMATPSQATVNGILVPVNGVASTPSCPTAPPVPLSAPAPAPASGPERRVIGYFAAWGVYGRNYHVPDIPAEKLTHINYAFANIGANLQIALGDPYADIDRFYPGDSWAPGSLRGSFRRLQLLKQAHPHVQTMISVGGWTWSSRFSDVALTPASRSAFAQSCVNFIQQYGFDGVDIDWEYPVSGGLSSNVTRPADRQNFTLLLAELRSQLDALGATTGRHHPLSIAAPAGPAVFANLELNLIHQYLDWINVMAYDFHGSWSPFTNHHSALYASPTDPSSPNVATQFNADAAISAYLAAGIPAGKLVLGTPFYGRGWTGVSASNNGLFQPFSGLPIGTWEPGVYDFEDVKNNLIPAGYTVHRDPAAGSPWVYHAQSGTMISFEDEISLDTKANYILSRNLGGAMFWELSGDDAPHSLLTVLHQRLLGPRVTLQAATSGSGAGDLYLRVVGAPAAASHIILLASATPAPGGAGTGPFLGLEVDPLLLTFLSYAPAPQSPLHWPVAANPYSAGPLLLPPCSGSALAGQIWEVLAAAYQVAPPGLVATTGIATLAW